jgi:hypothetical protein
MPVGNWNEDDEDEDEDFCVLVLDLDFVDRPLDEVSGLSSFLVSSNALATAAIAAARAAVSVPPAAIAPTAAAAVSNAVARLSRADKKRPAEAAAAAILTAAIYISIYYGRHWMKAKIRQRPYQPFSISCKEL